MDEECGKSIGKRITLPALTDEEADELLRMWQSKAMKDDKGNVIEKWTYYRRNEEAIQALAEYIKKDLQEMLMALYSGRIFR